MVKKLNKEDFNTTEIREINSIKGYDFNIRGVKLSNIEKDFMLQRPPKKQLLKEIDDLLTKIENNNYYISLIDINDIITLYQFSSLKIDAEYNGISNELKIMYEYLKKYNKENENKALK